MMSADLIYDESGGVIGEASPLLAAHPYEDWRAALDFAVDLAGMEASIFLRSWREGDWRTLDNEWPEWVAFMKGRAI